MSLRPPTGFLEKIRTTLQKIKAALSKDYSMQDVQRLLNLSKTWRPSLSSATQAAPHTFELKDRLKSLTHQLGSTLIKQRRILTWCLLLGLSGTLYIWVLGPYAQKLSEQLELRTAQWSQLQSLMKLSKTSATSSLPSTVAVLNEMELQKIRSVLTSRGFKPNVLRLSNDNPPRLEVQVSDAMFAVWLDALEEFRQTWRLYPEQMNIVATASAGIVNISTSLVQVNAMQAQGVGR